MKTAVLLASALALAAPLVPTTAMAQELAPPVQLAPNQAGQWVQLSDGSRMFVPQNAPTYVVDGVPYVYIYMPAYGWNWYASPWGAGSFAYNGAWRSHPWPYGFRAWHAGDRHYYNAQPRYYGGQHAHYYGGGQHQQHYSGGHRR